MSAEIIRWIRWRDADQTLCGVKRVYLGSENCENQLPALEVMLRAITDLVEHAVEVTLVTPVVTEWGLSNLTALFEQLTRHQIPLEVVFNDYGILETLTNFKTLEPVAGRLLSGQCCDPRLAAMLNAAWQRSFEKEIQHIDGTSLQLVYAKPDELLVRHLKRPAILNRVWLTYLAGLGVRRCEVSNLLQGLELSAPDGWKLSLHAPKVNIALRRCSLKGSGACGSEDCQPVTRLDLPEFELPIYLSGCEAYYVHESLPDLEGVPCVDRIVRSSG